ncbi:hypothetical protein AM1_1598 [Acaryochloris marina MBIC11017]|uniref:Uncharacterized protein n=1 Tax=Acaryochloris marina (strain MBIC 11017) TaxID=329726 RepID=B0CA35_ACAM1|nr:hypothetical protein AM1_1598 [Acaryochloris marina MBIC11017]
MLSPPQDLSLAFLYLHLAVLQSSNALSKQLSISSLLDNLVIGPR